MSRRDLSVADSTRRAQLLPALLLVVVSLPLSVRARQEANPAAPATPTAPATPQVASIDPPRVAPGFDIDLKITGQNFVDGTKVSFANPGIRLIRVTVASATELTVHIKVAEDAAPGTGSVFVVNPGDLETEASFEVTAKGPRKPASPPAPESPAAPGSVPLQRYSAFHLGNPAEVVQVRGKVKGALVVTPDAIKYQEGGQTLINVSLGEIKEIKLSSVPATFSIVVKSGKAFHFAAGSLRPSDARNIVDSLRAALPHAL